MLTYTETRSRQESETVTKNLIPYRHWGMFTHEGNRSLEKKAANLIAALEKTDKTTEHTRLLIRFLKSYRSMERFKSYGEAGDTEVRETVWDFFEKACKAVGLGNSADDLWGCSESYPK